MRELGNNLDLIKEFGCDDVVLRQVLRQLIYFIVSISLNQLLGKFPTVGNLLVSCTNLFFLYEGIFAIGQKQCNCVTMFLKLKNFYQGGI